MSVAPRIGPLARLPLFFALTDKRAVVAGGGEGAAWKAELLAAAGARVEVFAAELSHEMQALVAEGRVRHMARGWQAEDFSGAAVAIGEMDDLPEAEAFAAAARAARVPVNVIDKPAFCDFQVGTIINRSPVIVGVSTDGAAPILGQALRRRIEALLPAALSAWTAAAKGFRARLKALMPEKAARRVFWERFAEQAFAAQGAPRGGALETLAQEVAAGGAPMGEVILLGAGPGDPELLTLKALRILHSADVILHDKLISDGVLDLARREAERILVGKRGGKPSCRQEDINTLMLRLAREGKRVVRLKSGDPCVFGRAGEEVAACQAAGVRVSVVPGVTAATAAAAALSCSLTHRDHARRVLFLTGHAKDGQLPGDIDWARVADADATTVLYMGMRTAAAFAERAMAAGMAGDTPAVAVENASREDQRVLAGTLAGLGEMLEQAAPEGPVVVLIGRALGLAQV